MYISVPLKVLYQMPSGNNLFLVGGGLYAGFGVSGRSKGTTYSEAHFGGGIIMRDSFSTNEPLQFGFAVGQLKQMNVGINVTAFYLLQNNICFTLYSNFGLANLNNPQKTTTRASSAGITVGYVFGRKTKKS